MSELHRAGVAGSGAHRVSSQPAAFDGFRGLVTNHAGRSEAAVSVSMGTEIGSLQKAR